MPKSNDHSGFSRSGWRFSWRPDRLRRLHDLGMTFELTEDTQTGRDQKETSTTPASGRSERDGNETRD